MRWISLARTSCVKPPYLGQVGAPQLGRVDGHDRLERVELTHADDDHNNRETQRRRMRRM